MFDDSVKLAEAIRMRRKEEIEDYNKSLRKPDFEGNDDEGVLYGYWRMYGGVLKARKYKDGYHPYGYAFVEGEEIEMMSRLMKNAPPKDSVKGE